MKLQNLFPEMELNDYIIYLLKEKKSEKLINSHLVTLHEYLLWYRETFKKYFLTLIIEDVFEFVNYLKTVRNNSSPEINNKLTHLSKFNEYLIYKGAQSK